MPPWSWIASWPTCRDPRLVCSPAREAASASAVGVAGRDDHGRPVDDALGELEGHVHVGGPEREVLEGVEGDAELLAALEVVRRRPQRRPHRAERLVGSHHTGEVEHRRDARRQVATGIAERRRGCTVEVDAGGAGAVVDGVAGDRRLTRGDEEQPRATPGQCRADDQDVGACPVQDRLLGAGQRPRLAVPGGRDAVRPGGPPTAGLGVGERRQPLAARQRCDDLLPLLGGAAGRDQAAGDHHRAEVGLGCRHRPQLLADDADLGRARRRRHRRPRRRAARAAPSRPSATTAARRSRGPWRSRSAGARGRRTSCPRGRGPRPAAPSARRRTRSPSSSLQSPRIRPAMIWRWISLDPP